MNALNNIDRPVRFLVVLFGSLGDVARALFIPNILKSNFPGCHITWAIEENCLDLVRCSSAIDEVKCFERRKGIRAYLSFLSDLRSSRYDICLDLQRHVKSGFTSWISAAGRRIGFHRKNSKEGNWIFNNEHISFFDNSLAKIDHYAEFLRHLNLSFDELYTFDLKEPEVALDVGKFEPFVSIVLGSRWETKDWFLGGYKELVKLILTHTNHKVVLLGTSKEVDLGRNLEDHVGSDDRFINFVGKTTLAELIFLMSRAKLGIGPDSGPGHVAAAFRTPYVALFGPTDWRRVAPYGSEHLAVSAHTPCSPCWRKHCPGLNKVCMRLISASMVWNEAQKILFSSRSIGLGGEKTS